MEQLIYKVDNINSCETVRADKWLSEQNCGLTRSMLQKLIKEGNITVNDKVISKSCGLKNNDLVVVNVPEPVELDIKAENLPLEIVFQDTDLLVVNKPKGMVVHPAAGNYNGTLVNALLYHCKGQLSSINGVIRPGIVKIQVGCL